MVGAKDAAKEILQDFQRGYYLNRISKQKHDEIAIALTNLESENPTADFINWMWINCEKSVSTGRWRLKETGFTYTPEQLLDVYQRSER